jgi:hypothetical protein
MASKIKKPGPAMARSEFLLALGKEFFDGNGAPTWPTADTRKGRASQAANQVPAALRAMIIAVTKKKAPMGSASASSALGKVKTAAAATGWPRSKVAPGWKGSTGIYRHFEAAWAVNIMLKAFALSGGGGGPKDWPVNP